ncbi:hypothetical protein IHE45_14G084600 [Dioscorea alata]|uniref:Uncharacterized protein n=1 Tax=Dioscorea alata TaxID=55571 RepID=A0ACB7UT64_DIOAL|nr:hypothetical protein IHE45_14G084600 [Dioscorea alata]
MANHLARPPPSASSPLPISSPTTPKKPLFLVPNLHQRSADSANAAARRPPPPPPAEKIDPNMSGVTAKVLASKKRKEAMKAEIAKLREKGKVIE